MKPHWIRMQAFGPYGTDQTVDFRKLAKERLFLIHGPTGAGKSSVLDALCFALYGESSGEEREGQAMRSHHAPDNLPTEVTFQFELGGNSYRVSRSPRQELAKKHGQGMTVKNPTATLWALKSEDDENPEVLETKDSAVTKKIKELLGFEAAQFRQVVVLPQGAFQTFLMSKSDERQKILRTLFQTQVYERLQDALAKLAKDQADTVRTFEERRAALFHTVLPETDKPTREDLERLVQERQSEAERLRVEASEVKEHLATLQAALDEARSVARGFMELSSLREQEQRLAALAPSMEDKARELEWGRKALPRLGDLASLKEREREAAEAGSRLEGLIREVDHATREFTQAEAALQRAQKEAGRRDGLTLELATVAKALKAALGVEALRKDADGAEAHETTLRKHEAVLMKALAEAKTKLGNVEKQIQDLTGKAANVGLLEEKLHQARTAAEIVGKYLACREDYKQEKTKRDQADEALRLATAKREQTEIEVEQARLLREREQAVVLAQTLQDNTPCPVCGSLHHPSPARASGKTVPSDTTMKHLAKQTEEARKAEEGARAALHKRDVELERLKQQGQSLREQVGENADTSREVLEERIKQAETAWKEARRAENALRDAQAEQVTLKQGSETTQTQLDALREELILAGRKTESTQGKLAEAERQSGDKDAASLKAEHKRLDDELTRIEQALRQAEEAHGKAAGTKNRLDGELSQARRADAQAKTALEDQQTRFATALREAGFEDEASLVAAKRDERTLRDLEKELAEHQRQSHLVSENLKKLEEILKEKTAPDLGRLETEVAQAELRREETERQCGTVDEQKRLAVSTLEQMNKLDNTLNEAGRKAAQAKRLADVARGTVTGEVKISLERYVLATVLDEVLVKAGERLFGMSDHQYRLERKTDAMHKGIPAGLDVVVRDHTTGRVRDVATLSGGESFLASLCLALGLSDVVQTYSGGIHLDTLFIDEGFGSLDPEALDRALQSLVSLVGTNRLVGIISHVEELKTRIPTRLEIVRQARGSSIRWHVPG